MKKRSRIIGTLLALYLAAAMLPVSGQGRVLITGKVTGYADRKVFLKYAPAQVFPRDMSYADSSSIGKGGSFTMNFRWEKPGPAQLVLPGYTCQLFLMPGDTLEVIYPGGGTSGVVTYKGKAAPVNAYLEKARDIYDPSLNIRKKRDYLRKMDIRRFTVYNDSIRNRRWSFYNDYFRSSPPPRAFAYYEKSNIDYEWANDHFYYVWVRYRAELTADVETVDSSFYSFLRTVQLNNPVAMTSPMYFKFLGSYFNSLLSYYYIQPYVRAQRMGKLETDFYLKRQKLIREKLSGKPRAYMLAENIRKAMENRAEPKVIADLFAEFSQYNSELYPPLSDQFVRYQQLYRERQAQPKSGQPGAPVPNR